MSSAFVVSFIRKKAPHDFKTGVFMCALEPEYVLMGRDDSNIEMISVSDFALTHIEEYALDGTRHFTYLTADEADQQQGMEMLAYFTALMRGEAIG